MWVIVNPEKKREEVVKMMTTEEIKEAEDYLLMLMQRKCKAF